MNFLWLVLKLTGVDISGSVKDRECTTKGCSGGTERTPKCPTRGHAEKKGGEEKDDGGG